MTGLVIFSYLASGLNFSILPPVLQRWAGHLGYTDYHELSKRVFTWRSSGYVIGCIFGSTLFRWINRQACLALMYFLISTTLFTASLSKDVTGINVSFGLQGICTGISDAATSAIICQVWKDKSGPFLQCLYFVFAIGNTVAPLMAAPLLDTNFKIPIFITAAVVMLTSFTLVSLVFLLKEEDDFLSQETGPDLSMRFTTSRSNSSSWISFVYGMSLDQCKKCIEFIKINNRTVIIVILTALIILLYSGMEIVYWEFLAFYLQEVPLQEKITDEKASYMMAAVTYGFMTSRGVGIFVSSKVSPSKILVFDFVLLMTACLALLTSDSLLFLWIGNILNGIAFGTVYPQIYALVAKEIEVTNFYSSVFVFSSGLTAAYYPDLVSSQIAKNHQFLVWLVFSSVVASGVLLLAFVIFVKKYPSIQLESQEMPLVIMSSTTEVSQGSFQTNTRDLNSNLVHQCRL